MKIGGHRVNPQKKTYSPASSRRIPVYLIAFFLIAFLLTACTPVIGNTQPVQTEWVTLGPDITLGQTFVANYDGLSGMQITLSPQTPGTGEINFHLRSDAQSTTDIAVTSLSVPKVNVAGNYSFFFTPQSPSHRTYYYVSIDINGDGAVLVGTAGGDTYLDGARYVNSIAQDGQLSFRLMYSIRQLGLGLVREFAIWGVFLLAGIFLFLLPGWGLLKLLWPGWDTRPEGVSLTWMEKLGLSAGVSLAVYPILLLWTGVVGLRLGPLYAWVPPVAGIGILLWYNRASFLRVRPAAENQSRSFIGLLRSIRLPSQWTLPSRWTLPSLPTIVLLLAVALLVFTRFWAVRTLDAPMWGDSYQHTVITQLIVDHNGIFRSWQPYADLNTFTYHFGFHSAAAVFHWVTGLAMPRTILWIGQILNILAVLSLYPLAMKVCRNRWSGVTAVIIAGLLAPVPMSYTNWGRYPQLAGQIVLVAVIYLLWSVTTQTTETEKTTITITPASLDTTTPPGSPYRTWRAIALTAIVMGGLALTHYRVLVFAVLFVAAIFVSSVFSHISTKMWKTLALKMLWIGLGSGIIFLPWFINIFGGKILRNLTNQLTTPASAVPIDTQSYNAVGSLVQYLPVGVWLLLPLAAAWGLWKQHKGIALISLWGFLLLVAANPAWLSLPGTGALSNFAIFIAIYIPASILIGGAVGLLVEEFFTGEWRADLSLKLADGWKANLLRLGVVGVRKNYRLSKWMDGLIALVLIGVTLVSLPQRLDDLHPEWYALLTRPDLRAASWIKDNLHPNANLAVNSFFAYGGSLIAGSDGGWWLPVLTKRHTTLPPLNYGTESSSQSSYRQWVNELSKAITEKGITHPDVINMLHERKITQVYIGQRQGRVNYDGPVVFDPHQLANDPHFRAVYHQDRVWIFEVAQTP
jgi:hypothetical protein